MQSDGYSQVKIVGYDNDRHMQVNKAMCVCVGLPINPSKECVRNCSKATVDVIQTSSQTTLNKMLLHLTRLEVWMWVENACVCKSEGVCVCNVFSNNGATCPQSFDIDN